FWTYDMGESDRRSFPANPHCLSPAVPRHDNIIIDRILANCNPYSNRSVCSIKRIISIPYISDPPWGGPDGILAGIALEHHTVVEEENTSAAGNYGS
ncbi:MAG: hypothetical protein Q8N51_02350, partial [Gammaproteobacteria bacterium]|nr:hypothetical protein [Gammaproteobacteria bacterium]